MKKAAAYLLAFCLAVQTPFSALRAYAASETQGQTMEQSKSDEDETKNSGLPEGQDKKQDEEVGTATSNDADEKEPGKDKNAAENKTVLDEQKVPDEHSATGVIKVEITDALRLDKGLNVSVNLHSENARGGIIDRTDFVSVEPPMGEDSAEASAKSMVFDELPQGKYILTATAQGYEDYIQTIDVENQKTHSILLMNDYFNNYSYRKGEKHPGVMKLGDVSGNGEIDEEDLDLLLKAIAAGEDGQFTQEDCDLNGDGSVDLKDLQYFTIFYNNKADNQSAVVTSINIKEEDVVVASMSNALANGDISGLFTGAETAVSLSRIDESEINEDNPVDFTVSLENAPTVGALTIAPVAGSDNKIAAGTVTVVADDGSSADYPIETIPVQKQMFFSSAKTAKGKVTIDPDGSIVIDLGGQVAVKKVTIHITDTSDPDKKLVDISKVEFLNSMEDRIAPPVMSVPENVTVDPGSASFTVSWKKTVNVTGYEVKVAEEESETGEPQTQTFKTTANQLKVISLNNEKLINNKVYLVSVQAVNGDWKSGFSPAQKAVPKPLSRPDAPESVSIAGGYRKLSITWKAMKDTDSYTLYYRVAADTKAEFTQVDGIRENRIVMEGLKDSTEYEVYLIGHNEVGSSGPSKHYLGSTISKDPPITPNYKLINIPMGELAATEHVVKITDASGRTDMGLKIADNDYGTAWVLNDWDAGVSYPGNGIGKSPIVNFDDVYQMDTIVIIPDDVQPYSYNDYSVYCWMPDGKAQKVPGRLNYKRSSNGKVYYEFMANEPFEANRVQVNFSTGYGRRISIAEMKFYYYDSLEKDVYQLFGDEMHVTLAEGVTMNSVDELFSRLNTKDPVSGEFHPKKDMLETELETVKTLLNDGTVKGVLTIDTSVTMAADKALTIKGGLSARQPLGVTALAGDTITIYVGSPGKATGDATNLKIIATQYHGESSAWQEVGFQQLKAGQNQIEIPKITSLMTEQGGQLYIEYTGQPSKEQYAVRVSGGSNIPVLDVTRASDSNARMQAITEYVEELETAVAGQEEEHKRLHGEQAYEVQNCILGATDIVLPYMMYSVSSKQIWKGLGEGSTEVKAVRLDEALKSMEDMMYLFYQHKGLSNGADTNSNKMPVGRQNIRYQRMFAGAFMYAGGLHIGIEWGSIPGLSATPNVAADADGRYVSGRHFGWGIAHEIGHEINEGAYAIAEITNNYFSVLAQAKDTNDSVRFQYQNVYDKVTSGVTGRDSNVFTQLGLYWQLHLAYDKGGYNYKTYDKYSDQFDNLFFARVDTYVRNAGMAPNPEGVRLVLDGDTDNKLMRLACAAAEKNLLEFFTRWGMVPNDKTRQYAEQFPDEKRAIWFVNDEARVYEMEHGKDGSIAKETAVNGAVSYEKDSNEVKISLSNHAKIPEAMLGYEVYRTEIVKGKEMKTPVGFVQTASGSDADQAVFTDVISTVNNRAFGYEVVGYDKYLNPTKPQIVEPVKVSHGGQVSKDMWTMTTNMVSEEDAKQGTEDNPDELPKEAVWNAADSRFDTTYTGINSQADPYIIMNLNQEETVTGLIYTLDAADGQNPIGKYKIEVSTDGSSWTAVKTGTFTFEDSNGHHSAKVYFNKNGTSQKPDKWLYTYDASYIKLTAVGQKNKEISITELDILGNIGDNVELMENGIGVLAADYPLGYDSDGNPTVIPKDSILFTGIYKGNPAYNTVLLFDEKGNIVGGTKSDGSVNASQVIFADVPDKGELGETSEGTWVYYIEPENITEDCKLPEKVRAELYRTDDAHTNQGERLVSDTLFMEVPENLPIISLKSNEASAN